MFLKSGGGGRVRCLVVWAVTSAGLGLLGRIARGPLARVSLTPTALGGTPLDVALTDLAALALLACAVWIWAVTTAVVVEALRGAGASGLPPRGVPAGVRRAVLAACGVALAGGLAQPSYAAGPCALPAPHHRQHPALTGLPLPDRAVATPDRARHTARTVRVGPGDTLWSLAAGDLPAGSSDARIAARWHAIYHANRSLIGPDPDLIVPGLRLRLPGKDPS